MFNFLPKTPNPNPSENCNLRTDTLSLKGLDCPSCAVDIDLTLEELPGIISAKTNYPKSEINISFDPQKIKLKEIIQKITDLGYLK